MATNDTATTTAPRTLGDMSLLDLMESINAEVRALDAHLQKHNAHVDLSEAYCTSILLRSIVAQEKLERLLALAKALDS